MSQAQLDALCTRLEAVAARLEKAEPKVPSHTFSPGGRRSLLRGCVLCKSQSLAAGQAGGSGGAAPASASPGAAGVAAFVSAYDDQIGPKVTAWLALAKGCGDAVAAQVPAIVPTAAPTARAVFTRSVLHYGCRQPTSSTHSTSIARSSSARRSLRSRRTQTSESSSLVSPRQWATCRCSTVPALGLPRAAFPERRRFHFARIRPCGSAL